MPETISERVRRVVAETQKLPVDRVEEKSTFRELGIDSLDGLNILFALEEEFAVEVPDDAAREFASVREAVEGIARLLAAKNA
jgi:acyl carrier protein